MSAEAEAGAVPAERDAFIAAYRNADPSALISEAQRAWDGVAGDMWRHRAMLAAAPASTAHALPDVDDLAQLIRTVNGNHRMGAGALAEQIVAWIAAQPQEPKP